MFEQLKKELNLEHRHYFTNLEHNYKEDFYSDFVKFNKKIGLPINPVTEKINPLMPYQIEFFKKILKKQQKFHINKSRQIGVTELILRVIAFHCFNKYKGGKILIIAGTREKTASKIMSRLKQLFSNIPWTVEDSKLVQQLKLTNGTVIEALPSNSDAIRGDTKIKAIFVDEAAHFNLSDDSVVLDALQPIVFTNKADLFLVSTPNGMNGFFYDLSRQENDYCKLEYDYKMAINCIYTEKGIEEELKRNDIDVDQEYRCKFTSPKNAIFGPVLDEEIEDFETLE